MSDLHIPGFDILEKLGEGGMAAVWKARQVSLDRIVAIKILSERFVLDESDITRFQSEAQSAAKLKHPGIVQVYDASSRNGMYYFVMEYVDGCTVGDLIRRKRVLPEKDVLLVAECVADALGYAWEKERVIHCDIKPDNLIIDADGTVKVADLGLAKTIGSMAEEDAEELLGTPAYMSPEQARGDRDIDFRADIYSLGATIYHLLTGRLLFEGYSDEEIMENQLTRAVEDPLDGDVKLSHAVCWLMEKMLSKDKEARQSSWESVRKDIARAKRGHPPSGPMFPAGASTIMRSDRRTAADYARKSAALRASQPQASISKRVAIGLAVAAVFAALVFVPRLADRKPVQPPPAQPPAAKNVSTTQRREAQPHSHAKEMFEYARKQVQQNPAAYAEGVRQFELVKRQTQGTKYALMADEEIKRIEQARRTAIANVLEQLESKAEQLVAGNNIDDAITLYQQYSGVLRSETQAHRIRAAAQLTTLKAQKDGEARRQEQAAQIRLTALLDDIVSAIVNDHDLFKALQACQQGLSDRALHKHYTTLSGIRDLIQKAGDMDARILDSFRRQVGTEVTVEFNAGPRRLIISSVEAGGILGQHRVGMAVVEYPFTLDDLSMRERLARMGEDSQPEVALAKGIMAMQSEALARATIYFEKVEPLAHRLVAAVGHTLSDQAEKEARRALTQLMHSADVSVGDYDAAAWLKAVKETRFAPDSKATLVQAVENYRAQYGTTAFAREAASLLEALEQGSASARQTPPIPQREQPRVRAPEPAPPRGPVPVPAHLEAVKDSPQRVVNLLLQKNRGLKVDRVRILKNAAGDFYGIRIDSGAVDDISPVAALTKLKEFVYYVRGPVEGGLKDIEPLEHLPIERLTLSNCRVQDLAPLKEMPLVSLDLSRTRARDISVLKGKAIQSLTLSGTRIFDLGLLSALPIKHLVLSDTQTKDLSFARPLPLVRIDLANTKVYDLKPLAGKELQRINLSGTQIRDIALLEPMPLQYVNIANTSVNDLSPLKGKPLRYLNASGVLVRDFSLLANMPLTELHLAHTRFKDTTLLAGKKLQRLSVKDSDVKELTGLAGQPLVFLDIEENDIEDISPLTGIALSEFRCRGTPIKDFSPLGQAPIRILWIDGKHKGGWFIRSLPKLHYLNGRNLLAPRRR